VNGCAVERIAWYLASIRTLAETTPLLRAIVICGVLYQLDLAFVLAAWLLRKAGALPTEVRLEPDNRKSGIVVLPTLLRKRAELEGLMAAMRSVADGGYPGELFVVACIDGIREAGPLFDALVAWAARAPTPEGVRFEVAGTTERCGKAVAMDAGVNHVRALVAAGRIRRFPDLFFNMDADSTLGPGALERMVYRLTRKRWIARAPRMIVTSNVVVPLDQCFDGWRSLLSARRWLALSVAREYLGSITAGKVNWKLLPCTEVSGALYCTWADVYLAAPYYARFMQGLRLVDWLKWWVGFAPPRFSRFRGEPLPEALTGPGDDTWMGWFASAGRWRDGRIDFDFPRTPIHALARLVVDYVSRPVGFDPLAKVYSKTPTTAKALFNQRLRWNSSRVQDLMRHGRSLMYHWTVGLPLAVGTAIVLGATTSFALTPFVLVFGTRLPAVAPAFSVLAFAGYLVTRLTGTIAALLISDSPPAEWVKLLALPLSGFYHVAFNTLTLLIGYYRDALGFGEPTTFAPESTLIRSNLSRLAVAYRLRRAVLLAIRAARHGDVPFGRFWFGWRQTPYTPSGFEGWTSGKAPPPVFAPGPTRGAGGRRWAAEREGCAP